VIKVQLEILDGELDIEIKKEGDRYYLLVILSKSDYFKDKGRAWSGNTVNESNVREIAQLIKECYENPSILRSLTISDGMAATISLKEERSEMRFIILNKFDEGTNESQLLQTLFDFTNDSIQDAVLKNYTRLFGDLN
jgi:hypothetical protein